MNFGYKHVGFDYYIEDLITKELTQRYQNVKEILQYCVRVIRSYGVKMYKGIVPNEERLKIWGITS